MNADSPNRFQLSGGGEEIIRREYHLRGIVQGVGFRPTWARYSAQFEVAGQIGNSGEDVFLIVEGTAENIDSYVDFCLSHLPPLARVDHITFTTSGLPESIPHSQQPGDNPQPGDGPQVPGAHPESHPGVPPGGVTIVASTLTSPTSSTSSTEAGEGAVGHTTRTLIPPDVATCPECLEEMLDPQNRRYRYPFITCTNCGPRLSIIRDLPYDRSNTTLAHFPLCPECAEEYHDPQNRRFHAQPVSCFSCGPRLWWEEQPHQGQEAAFSDGESAEPWGRNASDDAIARARACLAAGGIIAVKGIGGFHLLADAANDAAVATLRRRKHRPAKPLAILVADEAMARSVACCDDEDTTRTLLSPARPIVLLPKNPTAAISELVAPGLEEIGVVVAYNPVYHLLLDRPVVCTSGNPPGEPLCHDNEQAHRVLGPVVDGFLFHDRPIATPVEDSVERPVGGHSSGRGQQWARIRRSRGRAPLPVQAVTPTGDSRHGTSDTHRQDVTQAAPVPHVILGVGGELKNTVCLIDGDEAFISAHVGDMGSLAAHDAWRTAVDNLLHSRGKTLADVNLIVADKHPRYASTQLAENLAGQAGIACRLVQHHQAHAAALLGEHSGVRGWAGPWAVFVADGTGFGDDGTIWGGEIFAGVGFPGPLRRMWHMPVFPLVGGDRAVRFPWRSLAGLNHALRLGLAPGCGAPDGGAEGDAARAVFSREAEVAMVEAQLAAVMEARDALTADALTADAMTADTMPADAIPAEAIPGVAWCSSLGRVLDALACLICGVTEQTYEGQAPMELEAAAQRATAEMRARAGTWVGQPHTLGELLRNLVAHCAPQAAASDGFSPEEVAYAAHIGIARLVAAQLEQAVYSAQVSSARQMPSGRMPSGRMPSGQETFVGFTGGCAVNRLLVQLLSAECEQRGLSLKLHEELPPTDGGLSYGQAVLGSIVNAGEC